MGLALDVQVGDRILLHCSSRSDIKLDGEDYLIMREDEVLGVSTAPGVEGGLEGREGVETLCGDKSFMQRKRISTSHLRRVNQLTADAVKVTLGPKGRNVVLKKKFGGPSITKDGVTVAKEIELKDAEFENMGAQMVREVALESRRRGRRRYHHRDPSWRNVPRGREVGGRWGEPDGAQARA